MGNKLTKDGILEEIEKMERATAKKSDFAKEFKKYADQLGWKCTTLSLSSLYFELYVPGDLPRAEFEKEVQKFCNDNNCSFELVDQAPNAPSRQFYSENMALMYPTVKDYAMLSKDQRKLDKAIGLYKLNWKEEPNLEDPDDQEELLMLYNEDQEEQREWKPVELRFHLNTESAETTDEALPYHVLAWNLYELIASMNNENAYMTFIYTWPDGETKEDCKYDFGTKEKYLELEDLAKKLYKRYHKDGLFTDDERVIQLAHQFDNKLGLDPITVISPKDLKERKDSVKDDEDPRLELLRLLGEAHDRLIEALDLAEDLENEDIIPSKVRYDIEDLEADASDLDFMGAGDPIPVFEEKYSSDEIDEMYDLDEEVDVDDTATEDKNK